MKSMDTVTFPACRRLALFLSKWGPLGAAAALLVGKWKSVFVLLKMAKLAPLLQIGASVAPMALSHLTREWAA